MFQQHSEGSWCVYSCIMNCDKFEHCWAAQCGYSLSIVISVFRSKQVSRIVHKSRTWLWSTWWWLMTQTLSYCLPLAAPESVTLWRPAAQSCVFPARRDNDCGCDGCDHDHGCCTTELGYTEGRNVEEPGAVQTCLGLALSGSSHEALSFTPRVLQNPLAWMSGRTYPVLAWTSGMQPSALPRSSCKKRPCCGRLMGHPYK